MNVGTCIAGYENSTPSLPVGTVAKLAVPNSNRSEEQYATPTASAALSDSESHKR